MEYGEFWPAPTTPTDVLTSSYVQATAARARGDYEDERLHWRAMERALSVPAESARWV
jgi:hypothetical protein